MNIKINGSEFKKAVINCDKVIDKKNYGYISCKIVDNFLVIAAVKDELWYNERVTLYGDIENANVEFSVDFDKLKSLAKLIKPQMEVTFDITDDAVKFKLDNNEYILPTSIKDFPLIDEVQETSSVEVDYSLLIKSMKAWTDLYKKKRSDAVWCRYFFIEVKDGCVRYIATNGIKMLIVDAGIVNKTNNNIQDAVAMISYDDIKRFIKLKNDGVIKLSFIPEYLYIDNGKFTLCVTNLCEQIYNYRSVYEGLQVANHAIINNNVLKDIVEHFKGTNFDTYKDGTLHLTIKNGEVNSSLSFEYKDDNSEKESYSVQGVSNGNLDYWCVMSDLEDVSNAFNDEELNIESYSNGYIRIRISDGISVLMTGCNHD